MEISGFTHDTVILSLSLSLSTSISLGALSLSQGFSLAAVVMYLAYDICSKISKARLHWYFCHSICKRCELLYQLTGHLIDWNQECVEVTEKRC